MNIWISTDSVGYIWNIQDAFVLREEYRILGSWVGCPSQAFQSSTAGLPLLLMPEEIDCLISNNSEEIRLLRADGVPQNNASSDKLKMNDEKTINIFNKLREESYQDQIKLYKNLRKQEVLQMVDKILEGKKRKQKGKKFSKSSKRIKRGGVIKDSNETRSIEVVDLSSSDEHEDTKSPQKCTSITETTAKISSKCDGLFANSDRSEGIQVNRDDVISEELKKIRDIPTNLGLVQTFHEHPWFRKDVIEHTIKKWEFGRNSTKDEIRSATFKFLWKAGFYLTAGDKFGADFLAYPGDPVLFHASYVVICYASNDCDILTINENELVAKCRLGTAVKKTILLSYFDTESGPKYDKSEKTVKFKVLKWTGSNSSTESI